MNETGGKKIRIIPGPGVQGHRGEKKYNGGHLAYKGCRNVLGIGFMGFL